jgi:MoxR-like ATPase
VLLADEINRTTPRTQSALLEAMSEGQVSVDGQTHKLPEPFFVIATQNPFEFEGTYPLPENQLDRFTLCMEVGYPSREAEKQALVLHRQGEPVDHLKPVVSAQQLQELQRQVREVKVSDAINDYLMDIVEATRQHDQLSLGLSTRGALTLYRAIQSQAFVEGRDYATPDDVKKMVPCVVAHRILCRGSVRLGQRTRARAILDTILQKTRIPS